MRSLRHLPFVALGLLVVPLLLAPTCGGPVGQNLEGEPCTRTTDCAYGLRCAGGTCRADPDSGSADGGRPRDASADGAIGDDAAVDGAIGDDAAVDDAAVDDAAVDDGGDGDAADGLDGGLAGDGGP